VLGGRTYLHRNFTLKDTVDEWAIEPKLGESREAYIKRSIEESRRFIRNYVVQENREPVFVLVWPRDVDL
jgi:hypothetical protein